MDIAEPIERCRLAAIDFESAGAAPGQTDQPVQIGIAQLESLNSPIELWDSYIATDHPVLWSASRIHGITNQTLQGAPSFLSLWQPIKKRLSNAVVIGHNHATERRFLRRFPGHHFGPWVDTLVLARMILPDLPDYSLQGVTTALGLIDELEQAVPGKTWHHALFDATASLLVVRFIIRTYHLESVPLNTLGAALREFF